MTIDQAIYNTVRYFDVIGLPVTSTQIWRCLLAEGGLDEKTPVRLSVIKKHLHTSNYLQEHLDMKWGYVVLKGSIARIDERLSRHALAQDKWKIMKRIGRVLSAMPFVKALAGSGSLALFNTHEESDLDVFIIAKANRIWTTRLVLLVVTQMLGRRRKYWDQKAPDKVCLNHYITDDRLHMNQDVQNVYTAVQYTLHVPVFGEAVLQNFLQQNTSWIQSFISAPQMPQVGHSSVVRLNTMLARTKSFTEALLLEPVGGGLEVVAKKIQQFFITKHKKQNQPGRLVFSDTELAFHPDTKVPAIINVYEKVRA